MDIQAFKIQVVPLREKIYGMSLRMLRCADDAEDTAQDVMLKLWTMRGKLREYRSIEALAVQICKNVNINKIKARKNTPDNAFETMQEPQPAPDRQLETADTVETVARIIERLPDLQRTIIRLRDIEGYSTAEIAQIMACEENAVNVNLFRARKKVREEFFKINNFGLL
jgi:RNA polymerase sigma-70 factor (ECF subfamily)